MPLSPPFLYFILLVMICDVLVRARAYVCQAHMRVRGQLSGVILSPMGSRVQTLVLRLEQHVLQPDEPAFWISVCIFIIITLCMPTTGYQGSESDLRK